MQVPGAEVNAWNEKKRDKKKQKREIISFGVSFLSSDTVKLLVEDI